MPITTICVRPVSGNDDEFDNVGGGPEEEAVTVVSHPTEMGYSPSLRRRCGMANVLSDLTDNQMASLQALCGHMEQVDEIGMAAHNIIDRSICRSARYRTRRNAVDLSNHMHPNSASVRVVDGEVCGGLQNGQKKPLQDNWVCG